MSDIKLPLCRAAFLAAFTPTPDQMDDGNEGKLRYRVTPLFPPGTDLKPLEREIAGLLSSKFGADKSKWPAWTRDKSKVLPFKDAGLKDYAGFEEGWTFFPVNSLNKPDLRYAKRDARGSLIPIRDEADLYSGVWVQLVVQPYLRKNPKNPGVSFDFRGLVLVREPRDDETPFVGRRTNMDAEFEGVDFGESEGVSADALFE